MTAASVDLDDMIRRLRVAARLTRGTSWRTPRTSELFSEAASALEAALAEIDRLKQRAES